MLFTVVHDWNELGMNKKIYYFILSGKVEIRSAVKSGICTNLYGFEKVIVGFKLNRI